MTTLTKKTAKKPKAKTKKVKRTIRVAKVELKVNKECRHSLEVCSLMIQEGVNMFFQRWQQYCTESGIRADVLRAAVQYSAWVNGERDVKPENYGVKCDTMGELRGKIFPASLVKDCLQNACANSGHTQRALALSINKFIGAMMGSSSSVNMPKWWCCLVYRESVPSLQDMSPIMFDKHGSNRSLLRSEIREFRDKDGNPREKTVWFVELNLPTRELVTAEIVLHGNHSSKYSRIIAKVVSGEKQGAGLVLFRSDRKWYLSIGHVLEKFERTGIRKGTVAYVAPGIDCPWMLYVPTEEGGRVKDWWASDGKFLENARRAAIVEEQSIKSSMKYHGSGSRGHGRERAVRGLCRSRDRWKGIVGNYNKHMVAKCVELVLRDGIESLVMLRPDPDSECGSQAFMASAGTEKDDAWRMFDWYNVMNMLRSKSQSSGIEFEDRKVKSLFTIEELADYGKAT